MGLAKMGKTGDREELECRVATVGYLHVIYNDGAADSELADQTRSKRGQKVSPTRVGVVNLTYGHRGARVGVGCGYSAELGVGSGAGRV